MNIKQKIQNQMKSILRSMHFETTDISVVTPQNLVHGDYTTNIAMHLYGKERKKMNEIYGSPSKLAVKIKEKFDAESITSMPLDIEKVIIVNPGFINLFLSKSFLIKKLSEVLTSKLIGNTGSLANYKIIIEFTDPNPFKEFHIGHLYSNTVGESISRLYEAEGAVVKRANYQGDVGLHVAKAIWGIRKQFTLLNAKVKMIEDLHEYSLSEKANFLGNSYMLGAKAYEEDSTAKEEILTINKAVYEKSDPEIVKIYDIGKAWSLAYFETLYKRLGTHFDLYYFESAAAPKGQQLVNEYLSKGVFTKENNAIIFKGEEFGLHTRVFINSLGLPTYEAKELGLAMTKYNDFAYDRSLIITGNEINEYFRVLIKVLSLINRDIADRTSHLSHGMVRLAHGKMSSRAGNVITGESLLNEVSKRIQNQYKDISQDIAEMIAVGAVKYALLKSSIGSDIAFDIDESISLEGNSGPYLQYAYVRTQSVIRKAATLERRSQSRHLELDERELNEEELLLLRTLIHFEEVVSEAAIHTSPNILATYLFNLAQLFNLFYQKNKIIETEEQELRLALTEAVGKILKRGLYLLGISVPDRM